MNIRDLLSIEGRSVLVTGGAGMYGRAITEGLLEAGAQVTLASRSRERLLTYRQELLDSGYPEITIATFDQAEPDSIDRCLDELEAVTSLDVLVNNAVARPMKGFQDGTEAFDTSMRVNATGLFHLTRRVADGMAASGGGSIINIASIQGVVGVDPSLYEGLGMTGSIPDYFFHKAGMINLTRFFASEYGVRGVRVNAVSPGGLYSGQNPEFVRRYSQRTMVGRMADYDDIKGIIVFLASDASRYITGENIMVDGGYVQK